MHSGERINPDDFWRTTPLDVVRWLVSACVVAGSIAGLAVFSRTLESPAGEQVTALPPVIMIELAPSPVPQPEPAEPPVEPAPTPTPQVEPEAVAEPQPVEEAEQVSDLQAMPEEAATEPLREPAPALEPPEVEEPAPIPEPEIEPEPELPATPRPDPAVENPTSDIPQPATMSADLQRRRLDTPATTRQQPQNEKAPTRPNPPTQTQATPKQQAAAQPSTVAGPSPAEWQQQVLRHLDRRKVYPRSAQRANEEGVVLIAFSIDASGRVLSASVAGSSGFPALDQAALETVRRASPLPSPPQALGHNLSLTAPIRFNIR